MFLLGRRALHAALALIFVHASVLAADPQQARPQTAAASAPPPQVAFTFDDLPAHGPLPPRMARPDVVRSIVATLQREKMPPVYGFINGFRVARYPYQRSILQAWRAAGNPLGNHTWSHPELDKVSAKNYEHDIARNEPLLRQLSQPGDDWHWFRYPFLEEGDTLAKREAVRGYLAAHRYQIAQVSMDFQDYLWNEPYARCSAKHDEAAIGQLHDSYLATADLFIGVFRKLSQNLYGRDVPYVLLMHVGAFDARMLPELIALFASAGLPSSRWSKPWRTPPTASIPRWRIRVGRLSTSRWLKSARWRCPMAPSQTSCWIRCAADIPVRRMHHSPGIVGSDTDQLS